MICSQFRTSGFVLVVYSYDVLTCLQGFPVLTADALLRGELLSECSCVSVAGATLDQATKEFALILELYEVFGGVEGWRNSIGYCESPFMR